MRAEVTAAADVQALERGVFSGCATELWGPVVLAVRIRRSHRLDDGICGVPFQVRSTRPAACASGPDKRRFCVCWGEGPPAIIFAVTSTGGFFFANDTQAREEALALLHRDQGIVSPAKRGGITLAHVSKVGRQQKNRVPLGATDVQREFTPATFIERYTFSSRSNHNGRNQHDYNYERRSLHDQESGARPTIATLEDQSRPHLQALFQHSRRLALRRAGVGTPPRADHRLARRHHLRAERCRDPQGLVDDRDQHCGQQVSAWPARHARARERRPRVGHPRG